MDDNKRKALSAALGQIEKQFGKGAVMRMGDVSAVRDADVLVIGVPSHVFRHTLEQAAKHVRAWVPVVSLAKGLEQGTLLRMTEVIGEVLPGHRAGVLTGPNLAREIMSGFAAASVIAMEDGDTARELQKVFHSGLFRVYTNPDAVGCEVGGALKNVIAIAVGICDGLGLGLNARAALMTRGLREITRLGEQLGADPRTFLGLAGMGDLVLTCTGDLSRNRQVGLELAAGRSLEDIVSGMSQVAEGIRTTRSACALAELHGVEMPISEGVRKVLAGELTPAEAAAQLMSRQLRNENE